jgi:hypothetical protein
MATVPAGGAPRRRRPAVKYLLIMQINPVALDALTEEQREEIMKGHDAFMATIKASGEFVETHALGMPDESAVVRVRDGVQVVTDGPYLEAKEFVGGYYMVDVETRERALELAALIPDAGVEGLGIEVRPVVHSVGPND